MTPLSDEEFAAAMARVGLQEAPPLLALAVSGGGDSLCLALLATVWSAARGGRAVALTVDHGLRAGSAQEAAQVAGWLAARGIEQHTLRCAAPVPRSNIEAAARASRYRLLLDWCREAGCRHLLLGHALEDQAETFLLRLGRGSGVDGLAAMPAVSEREGVRLLRPLLDVPRARLRARLRGEDQPWIEDPSNADPRFARNRLRQAAPVLEAAGLQPARLAATARRMARARTALEGWAERLLGEAAELHPAGFAWLHPEPLVGAPEEIGLRALARLLRVVGGADYPPRLERLERLHAKLALGLAGGATLAGCRLVPRRGRVLVFREPAAAAAPAALRPGTPIVWDGRYRVCATRVPPGATLGALGVADAAIIAARVEAPSIPPVVRPSLPAIRGDGRLVAVPHLGWGSEPGGSNEIELATFEFAPTLALWRAAFTVV